MIFRRIFFLTILFMMFWANFHSLALSDENAAPRDKRVLFISSYHPDFPTFSSQIEGLRSVLKPAGINYDIEFIDSKRFGNQSNIESFFQRLEFKLKRLPKYDLIMTGDDVALNEVLQRQHHLFNNIPIIFFGLNDLKLARELETSHSKVTGITESVSMVETVKLATQLFPEHPLVVITDGTHTAKKDLETFLEVVIEHNIAFRIVSLRVHSFQELLDELKKLPAKAPILLLSAYSDSLGAKQEFKETFMQIHQSTKSPIFHLWEHGLGDGVLGGKMISHFEQARHASTIAIDVLSGKAISNIPIVFESPNRWYFDYELIERFHLDKEQLPPSAIFINSPEPMYQKYWYALVSLSFFLVLVIAILLWNLRVRYIRNKITIQHNKELERKVKQRTSDLEQAKSEVSSLLREKNSILENSVVAILLVVNQKVAWCNKYAAKLFGLPVKEIEKTPIINLWPDKKSFYALEKKLLGSIKSKGFFEEEVEFISKDNQTFWGLTSAKTIETGTFKSGVLIIISDITKLKSAQQELSNLNNHLNKIARLDELTGLFNRRYINEILSTEFNRLKRYSSSFSIILMDVDHFKLFNDQYGHLEGDRVLKTIANLVSKRIREVDEAARWGGEEFLIVCPQTPLQQAMELAESIRIEIENYGFGFETPVTSSFGVYSPSKNCSLHDALKQVDDALYEAKVARNCVSVKQ